MPDEGKNKYDLASTCYQLRQLLCRDAWHQLIRSATVKQDSKVSQSPTKVMTNAEHSWSHIPAAWEGKKLSRSHCHANRIWPWKCMLGLLAAVHKPPGNNVVGGVSSPHPKKKENNASGKLSTESSNMNNNDQQWEAHDTHNIISTMDLYLLFSTIGPGPWAPLHMLRNAPAVF